MPRQRGECIARFTKVSVSTQGAGYVGCPTELREPVILLYAVESDRWQQSISKCRLNNRGCRSNAQIRIVYTNQKWRPMIFKLKAHVQLTCDAARSRHTSSVYAWCVIELGFTNCGRNFHFTTEWFNGSSLWKARNRGGLTTTCLIRRDQLIVAWLQRSRSESWDLFILNEGISGWSDVVFSEIAIRNQTQALNNELLSNESVGNSSEITFKSTNITTRIIKMFVTR